MIVVDGYVKVGQEQKPGLGMHLYQALVQQIAVIGGKSQGDAWPISFVYVT